MAEVASAFVSLKPAARGFAAGINREIGRDLDRAGRDGGKRFGAGMSTGLAGIGSKLFGPLAAAAAAVSVGSFFKGAIAGASDLQESGTKIAVIFGKDGAAAVNKFASAGAKALGQTKVEVLGAAGTFGVFGKAAGLSGVGLAKFSTGFASLSTDMASFSNTSPEEAVEAIGAALRGESEPIRKYGVLLDDATLRNEALKLGLIETTKQALTPQQRVLAAQAAIYKQTRDAQGDFARTSGGLANQQRILSAQFTDLKNTIGTALLPVATKFVSFLNDSLGPGLAKVGTDIAPAKAAINGFFSAGAGGPSKFAPLIAFFQTQLVPAFAGIVTAVRSFVTVALPIVQQFTAGMTARLAPMLPTIRSIFGLISTIIVQVLGVIRTNITNATMVIAFIWRNWGQGIMNYASKIFGNILTIIQGALKIISGVIKVFTSVLKGDWRGAWDGIKQIVSGAWGVIKGTVSLGINVVKAVVAAGLSLIKGVFSLGWNVLKSIVASAWRGVTSAVLSGITSAVILVRSLPGKIAGAIGDLSGVLLGAGRSIIDGFLAGINEKFQAVKNKLSELTGMLPDWKGPLTADKRILRPSGQAVIGGFVAGIEDQFGTVKSSLRGLTSSLQTPAFTGADAGGAGSLATGAAAGGQQVFHLYDSDGILLGTMRGVAGDVITAQSRRILQGTRF